MWSVNRAHYEDAPEILTIQKRAFERNQRKYDSRLPQLTESVESVRKDINDNRVFVARQSGKIIGAVRYRVEGNDCEAYSLSVDPAFSKLDVGTSLMIEVEEQAVREGVHRVVARTGLRDSAAIEFYTSLKYRPVELVVDDERKFDTVVFEKSVG